MRLSALVGVLPHEQDRPQPVELDLDVQVDLTRAGASDALEDTVDYGALCELVEGEVVGKRFALLEALAARVADAVLAADARIAGVTVAVKKLRPPVAQHLATSGVRITRGR